VASTMTSTWPPLSNLFGGRQSGPPYMNESASIARILYQDAYILAENGAGGAGGQGTAAPTRDFHCWLGPEARGARERPPLRGDFHCWLGSASRAARERPPLRVTFIVG